VTRRAPPAPCSSRRSSLGPIPPVSWQHRCAERRHDNSRRTRLLEPLFIPEPRFVP
jgi:hypothetical protein